MCQLFRTFGLAMDSEWSDRTSDFFSNVDRQLREMRQIQSKREFQQADFLITQQWMRMVLWKTSMFHIKLSADAKDENLSILFPEQVAQSMFVYLNRFSPNIVEAHGIGMVSLFGPLASITMCKIADQSASANETSRRCNLSSRYDILYSLGFTASTSHANRPE
jgi:hypothetical protein